MKNRLFLTLMYVAPVSTPARVSAWTVYDEMMRGYDRAMSDYEFGRIGNFYGRGSSMSGAVSYPPGYMSRPHTTPRGWGYNLYIGSRPS